MATNITFHAGAQYGIICQSLWFIMPGSGSVESEERIQLLDQKGVTIWFTGLSASGKVDIPYVFTDTFPFIQTLL